jgi:hypothetical protein
MPRLLAARWRYRLAFVRDLGTLCTQALCRAGYAPGAVSRALVVLATWAALLVTLTVYLARR